MRRPSRTVFLYLLLLAGCFAVAGGGVVAFRNSAGGNVQAQDDVAKPKPDLFADLPTDGVIEGKVPERTTKVVVLRAANVGSIHDVPENDLKSNDRFIAEGLALMLEQQIQYLPQLTGENATPRVNRFAARLRHPGVPHATDKQIAGVKHARLDEGLRTFNAGLLIVLSFVPGEEGTTALAYRYSADKGVHANTEWVLGKIGKPEPDTVTRKLEEVVESLCEGVGAPVEHAPVPRLVTNDKALRAFARMTIAYKAGNATEAWVEYETLMTYDPRAGRSAHYAMEMFLALSEEQANVEEHQRLMRKAVEAGREALKHVPNDTHIRGRLGWIGALHFGRQEFGRKAIEQALKIQPANLNEIERYLTVFEIESAEKQLAWLKEYALPKVKDGRAEGLIALNLFNRGDYAGGVEWYKKAQAIAPGDFETQLGAGLCGFYKGDRLAKERKNDEARAAFADATEALKAALRIDAQEVPYLYDYYVRAATHDYTWLPTNSDDLNELFMVQTVLTALQSSSRTFQWDRLVKDVLAVQKRLVKDSVRNAEPGDDLYVLRLLARLRLSFADNDKDDVVHTLWLLKEAGFRPEVYYAYMNSFGPVVHEYKPPEPDPPGGEHPDESDG